ncbi:MAG: DUF3343 domain-containing protein [bacterium]
MACVATFNATHYALRAEKLLKKEKLGAKLVPVPRQVSSNCGLALEFDCSRKDFVNELFKNKNVTIHGIFDMDKL